MKLKGLFPPITLGAAALAVWIVLRNESGRLKAELDLLRDKERAVQRQNGDDDLRRRLEVEAEERAATDRAIAERDRLSSELSKRPATAPTRVTEFKLGEWTSPREWKNRGAATAKATMETAFWAAAGGDAATLSPLLDIGPQLRERAARFLAGLTPEAQAEYPTGESLIAAFTIKSIPLGDAQLVWYREHGTDEAIVGVVMKDPESWRQGGTGMSTSDANRPPQQPDDHGTKLALLSLRRNGAQWRLVVPPVAMDRIEEELARGSNR